MLKVILTLLTGVLAGPRARKLLEQVISSFLNNPQTGGLAGLLKRFQDQGLDGVVSSWVSTGQNLPVNKTQVENVFGPDQIQQMAQSLGVSNRNVSATLAKLLPKVVDMLTPDGKLPDKTAVPQRLAELRQKLFV
ncbi:MAG: YidB family protein [Gammaproteobacteria bacterium]